MDLEVEKGLKELADKFWERKEKYVDKYRNEALRERENYWRAKAQEANDCYWNLIDKISRLRGDPPLISGLISKPREVTFNNLDKEIDNFTKRTGRHPKYLLISKNCLEELKWLYHGVGLPYHKFNILNDDRNCYSGCKLIIADVTDFEAVGGEK